MKISYNKKCLQTKDRQMPENLIETQYNITKKSRIKRFYESNKILIYSTLIILLIIFGTLSYYFESKQQKKILLSENFVQAKIYIETGNKVYLGHSSNIITRSELSSF